MNLIDRLKKSNGVATNSLLLTFVQIITTVLGLVVTKLLSVHFSLQEYGTYSQALLVTTTATSISILGLSDATNYFYNRNSEESEQKKYIATIFAIEYAIGIVLALALIGFRFPIASYFGNERLVSVLPIVAFTPLLMNLASMFQVLYVSIGKAKIIAIRNLIISIVRLFAVVIACYVLDNIVTVLVVILCLDFMQFIYFFTLFKRYRFVIRVKEAEHGLIKEILAFSIPMSIYVLTNTLSRDIDKYVISAFSNTETLAIYTNAAKVLPFDILAGAIMVVLVPFITRMINQKEYEKAKEVFKLYLRTGYVLTFIFVGGAIAVSKNLMLFLYDAKYLAGLPVFIIYLVVDMIRFANVTTILSGAGKTRILMGISVTTMVLNAFLNVIGYKLFGLVGPAIATLLLTIGMTIVLLHFGAREIKTKVWKLFNFKEIGIVGIQIVGMGLLAYWISAVLNQRQFPNTAVLIICYGIYIVVLGLLNFRRAFECYQKLNHYK